MRVTKRDLLPLGDIYTATAFELGGRTVVALGQEREGRIVLYDPSTDGTQTVSEGPGGVMSVVPVPGRDDMLLSVQGLFPPFIGHEGGIYRHLKTAGKWLTDKAIELPFVHRCEIVRTGGGATLISATVSEWKDNPADWSRPGRVYATRLEIGSRDWNTAVVMDGLHRNHGMVRCVWNGREAVCVSGAEGIFAIFDGGSGLTTERLFEGEVSEFAFLDPDDNGRAGLATIEPFHGESLNIYRRVAGAWEKTWDSPLDFGHGLSAGTVGGTPCLAVGNRRGDGSLQVWSLAPGGPPECVYSEPGTGTTQTQFLDLGGSECLLAANQTNNEAVIYNLNYREP